MTTDEQTPENDYTGGRIVLELNAPLTRPAVGPVVDLLTKFDAESRLVAVTIGSGGEEVRIVCRIKDLHFEPLVVPPGARGGVS